MQIACRLCGSHATERLALTYSKGTSKSQGWAVSMSLLGPTLGALVGMAKFFPSALGIIGLPISVVGFVMAAPFALVVDFVIVAVISSLSVTRMKGTTQSYLAVETAPPPRFRLLINSLRALFFGLFAWAAFSWWLSWSGALDVFVEPYLVRPVLAPFEVRNYWVLLGYTVFITVAPVLLLIGGYLYWGIRYNREVWPVREAGWQRTFLCKRCGGTFVVPEFDPYGVNKVRSDRAGKGKGEYLPHVESQEERDAVNAKVATDAVRMRGKRG